MAIMERERRPRRSFSKEFKRDAVDLARSSGKTVPEVARDLDLTESALRQWHTLIIFPASLQRL